MCQRQARGWKCNAAKKVGGSVQLVCKVQKHVVDQNHSHLNWIVKIW